MGRTICNTRPNCSKDYHGDLSRTCLIRDEVGERLYSCVDNAGGRDKPGLPVCVCVWVG